MALELVRLDTTPPPLWEGYWGRANPMALDPWNDPDTSLEHTAGEDVVNEYTAQRVEGDLWRRDFVNERNIRRLFNFLESRTGILLNTPAVRLISGATLDIGWLIPATRPDLSAALDGWYYVAASLIVLSGSYTAGQPRLSLHNLTDNVVEEYDVANTVSFKAATMLDRGELLDPAKNYAFRLHNDSANTLVMIGWALIQASPLAENDDASDDEGSSSSS